MDEDYSGTGNTLAETSTTYIANSFRTVCRTVFGFFASSNEPRIDDETQENTDDTIIEFN